MLRRAYVSLYLTIDRSRNFFHSPTARSSSASPFSKNSRARSWIDSSVSPSRLILT